MRLQTDEVTKDADFNLMKLLFLNFNKQKTHRTVDINFQRMYETNS